MDREHSLSRCEVPLRTRVKKRDQNLSWPVGTLPPYSYGFEIPHFLSVIDSIERERLPLARRIELGSLAPHGREWPQALGHSLSPQVEGATAEGQVPSTFYYKDLIKKTKKMEQRRLLIKWSDTFQMIEPDGSVVFVKLLVDDDGSINVQREIPDQSEARTQKISASSDVTRIFPKPDDPLPTAS